MADVADDSETEGSRLASSFGNRLCGQGLRERRGCERPDALQRCQGVGPPRFNRRVRKTLHREALQPGLFTSIATAKASVRRRSSWSLAGRRLVTLLSRVLVSVIWDLTAAELLEPSAEVSKPNPTQAVLKATKSIHPHIRAACLHPHRQAS